MIQARLHISIVAESGGRGSARKTLDLPCAPSVGMEIEAKVWDGSRKVENVTLNLFDEPYLFVYMGMDHPGSEAEFESTMERYKDEGWEIL